MNLKTPLSSEPTIDNYDELQIYARKKDDGNYIIVVSEKNPFHTIKKPKRLRSKEMVRVLAYPYLRKEIENLGDSCEHNVLSLSHYCLLNRLGKITNRCGAHSSEFLRKDDITPSEYQAILKDSPIEKK